MKILATLFALLALTSYANASDCRAYTIKNNEAHSSAQLKKELCPKAEQVYGYEGALFILDRHQDLEIYITTHLPPGFDLDAKLARYEFMRDLCKSFLGPGYDRVRINAVEPLYYLAANRDWKVVDKAMDTGQIPKSARYLKSCFTSTN